MELRRMLVAQMPSKSPLRALMAFCWREEIYTYNASTAQTHMGAKNWEDERSRAISWASKRLDDRQSETWYRSIHLRLFWGLDIALAIAQNRVYAICKHMSSVFSLIQASKASDRTIHHTNLRSCCFVTSFIRLLKWSSACQLPETPLLEWRSTLCLL